MSLLNKLFKTKDKQQLKDQNRLLANASWKKPESSCNFSEKLSLSRGVIFYHTKLLNGGM